MPRQYRTSPWSPDTSPKLVEELVANMEDDFEDDDQRDAAKVLISGLFMGTDNIFRISDFSGVPISKIKRYATNLRKSGVWTYNGKTHCQWEEGEGRGDLAFILDVMVATGKLKRVRKNGELAFESSQQPVASKLS